MIRKTVLATAIAGALATMSFGALALQGPSSSADSYLLGVAPGVSFTSILTTGNTVGGYMMAGIPDGLGAYDNNNGTITVLMNHEISSGGGSHGVLASGAFVSEWVINKTTLAVTSGRDLITSTYDWNASSQSSVLSSGMTFSRFCSADLAATTAFSYNGIVGTSSRIFLNGEEGGAGRAVATVATGVNKGSAFVLGKMNQATNGTVGGTAVGGWENLLANPYSQLKTVVIGNNDGGTGIMNNALAVYVGTKTNSGSDIDRAGLTNGVTKFVNVAGIAKEVAAADATTRNTTITNGTRFTLDDTKSTTFSRPEDGAWNPNNAKEYYFVTTDQLDQTDLAGGTQKGGTRLMRLTFDDLAHVENGGKIDVLLDSSKMPGGLGVSKPNMFDNMTVNADGTLTLQEDVGNANHNGKMWLYDPVTGTTKIISKFDPALFGDVSATGVFTAGTHTKDEETSGIIDVTALLGRNDGAQYSLLVVQDHASAASLGLPSAAVEGGQLLLMSQSVAAVPEPETYAMMLAGLGMIGGIAARRRNRKAA